MLTYKFARKEKDGEMKNLVGKLIYKVQDVRNKKKEVIKMGRIHYDLDESMNRLDSVQKNLQSHIRFIETCRRKKDLLTKEQSERAKIKLSWLGNSLEGVEKAAKHLRIASEFVEKYEKKIEEEPLAGLAV